MPLDEPTSSTIHRCLTLMSLVRDEDRCNELLRELDRVAREEVPCECGLPVFNEASMARMREVLYRWAASDR